MVDLGFVLFLSVFLMLEMWPAFFKNSSNQQ